MKIMVFNKTDLKVDGTLKKKNNVKYFIKEDFIQYIKSNHFTLKSGYIDVIGYISNNESFKCFYKNMIVGVTSIIKECEIER